MRAEAPEVRPALDWRFPVARESVVAGSLRLVAFHCPGQYVVHVTLRFDVPLSAEPREREGVAGLAARCLTRGAGDLTADAFSDALAACGAELEAAAMADGFAVRLSVPLSRLGRGLDLLALAVTDATYNAKDVEQEQRLRLQEIEQAKAYPGVVTVEQLNAALFGTARAARPLGGTTASVAAVTRDDVVDFSRRHLRMDRAVLLIGGDLAGTTPHAEVERAFRSWDGNPATVTVADEASPVSTVPRLLLVDWPDSPQATLRIGGPGIGRADPRWPAMFVANYAVGGSFGSRLNTVLRERKGLTYGIGSTLETARQTAILGIGASVTGSAAAEAVSEVLSIVREARGTLAPDEVAAGVRAATDSAALSFERAEAVVGRAEMLVSQRLPLDHVDQNLRRIRAVTPEAANAAYSQIVDPAAFTVVLAGDAASLVEPLTALAHAPVEVLPRP